MIHTFGDSHSRFGWQQIKKYKIKINHLGPKLMFSFGKEKNKLIDLTKYTLSSGDAVIYCFGEIDCRCHIHKYVVNDDYQSIIDPIVDNYISAIILNINYYSNKNIKTCVYSITPPVIAATSKENPDFPFLGSDHQRKKYHTYMNQKIKEKCAEYNIIFFDVSNLYSDDGGFLKKELSDGICHILNPIYIEQKIQELKL